MLKGRKSCPPSYQRLRRSQWFSRSQYPRNWNVLYVGIWPEMLWSYPAVASAIVMNVSVFFLYIDMSIHCFCELLSLSQIIQIISHLKQLSKFDQRKAFKNVVKTYMAKSLAIWCVVWSSFVHSLQKSCPNVQKGPILGVPWFLLWHIRKNF